ncbi:hypothetical protein PAXRUDRAFT_145092, partial [Paxillus rubicundulus Ve08.2h10]
HLWYHLLIFDPTHLFMVQPSCHQPHPLILNPTCSFMSFSDPTTCLQTHPLIYGLSHLPLTLPVCFWPHLLFMTLPTHFWPHPLVSGPTSK